MPSCPATLLPRLRAASPAVSTLLKHAFTTGSANGEKFRNSVEWFSVGTATPPHKNLNSL
jgi:hypothetical protein